MIRTHWLRSLRQALGLKMNPPPRSMPARRRSLLQLEPLEDRALPTTTLFLDFGDVFPTGGLSMTVMQLRDTFANGGIQGPDLRTRTNASTGKVFADSDNVTFSRFPATLSFDYNGDKVINSADTTALRADVVALVQRYYEPFDVNVVTAASASLADIRNRMNANSNATNGRNDAYVLAAEMSPQVQVSGVLYGVSPGVDLAAKSNGRDDTVLAFAQTILSVFPNESAKTALAYTLAHEAAHSFGLEHTTRAGDNDLLTQSDIIPNEAGNQNRQNPVMFTRFPLTRVDGLAVNNYDQIANDADIGLRGNSPGYITGTGAHDRIFVSRANPTQAQVMVYAYKEKEHTNQIGSDYTYLADMTNGLLIDAGGGNDEIILDSNMNTTVTVRGMEGADTVRYDGRSLADNITIAGVNVYGPTNVSLSEVENLYVDGRAGEDTISVLSTAVNTTVEGGGGGYFDTVNVGEANRMQGIRWPLLIKNSPNYSRVNFNNSADTQAHLVSLTTDSVTGLAPVPIRFVAADLKDLTINGGSAVTGQNIYRIQGTPASITTTINGGSKSDQFLIESTTGPLTIKAGAGDDRTFLGGTLGSLDLLQGKVTVDGGAGTDRVEFWDYFTTAGQSYSVGVNTVTRSGGVQVSYTNFGDFALYGGAGNDQVAVSNLRNLRSNRIDAGEGNDAITLLTQTAGYPVTLFGAGGNDVINIGRNNLLGILGTISVNGGTGANVLHVNDRTGTTTNAQFLIQAGQVSANDNLFVNYAAVQAVQITGGSGGAGRNIFNVQSTSPGVATTVIGGTGTDVLNFNSLSADTAVSFDGGLGDDRVAVGSFLTTGPIRGTLNAAGGAGFNAIVVHEERLPTGADYVLTADSLTANHDLAVSLSQMQELTVQAGNHDNTFNIVGTAAGRNVTLNGGSGSDHFVFGDAEGAMNGLQGGLTLNGKGGFNLATFYDWLNDEGQTYQFTDGAMTRTGIVPVNYSNLGMALLYCGAGDDRIEARGTAGAPVLNVNDNAGTDVLVGPDAGSTWRIREGGIVEIYRAEDDALLAGMAGVENLIGGLAADRFEFEEGAALAGTIEGGGGTNALDYSLNVGNVSVNLVTGSATGAELGVSGIQKVTGGGGDDILVGAGGNVLAGGAGRDLLIAGALASVLQGGAGEDLLVAGTTASDVDQGQLEAIRDFWARTDLDYDSRADALLSGTGTPALNAQTVASNGGSNVLHGGDEADFFFCLVDTEAEDRSAGERLCLL